MKSLILILSALAAVSAQAREGSEGVGGSQVQAIQIQGPAADYLYVNLSSSEIGPTTCYTAMQTDGSSLAECDLSGVFDVIEEEGTITVTGLPARELYRKNISSESVACATALQTDGSTEIQCRLTARVVGKNY